MESIDFSRATALEFIKATVRSMKHSDLLELRNEIDFCLKVDIPKLRLEAFQIYLDKGVLHAVKGVKDKTGWTLKECKEFMDGIRAYRDGGEFFTEIKS
jgi:hypothetical protein